LFAPQARKGIRPDNPSFVGAVALPSLCVKRFAFSSPRRLRLQVNSTLSLEIKMKTFE
jgi:hypothetical protein